MTDWLTGKTAAGTARRRPLSRGRSGAGKKGVRPEGIPRAAWIVTQASPLLCSDYLVYGSSLNQPGGKGPLPAGKLQKKSIKSEGRPE